MILVQPQQAILDENFQEFLEDSFVAVTGIMISRGDVKLSNSEMKTSTFGSSPAKTCLGCVCMRQTAPPHKYIILSICPHSSS